MFFEYVSNSKETISKVFVNGFVFIHVYEVHACICLLIFIYLPIFIYIYIKNYEDTKLSLTKAGAFNPKYIVNFSDVMFSYLRCQYILDKYISM